MGVLHDNSDSPAPYRSASVPPAQERQVKFLRISIPGLVYLFRAGADPTLVKHPLPADARFLRWHFDGLSKDLVVTVWSASFPELPPGGWIPDLEAPQFSGRGTDG